MSSPFFKVFQSLQHLDTRKFRNYVIFEQINFFAGLYSHQGSRKDFLVGEFRHSAFLGRGSVKHFGRGNAKEFQGFR